MPEYGHHTDNMIVSDKPVKKKYIGTFHAVKRVRFRKYDMYADEGGWNDGQEEAEEVERQQEGIHEADVLV